MRSTIRLVLVLSTLSLAFLVSGCSGSEEPADDLCAAITCGENTNACVVEDGEAVCPCVEGWGNCDGDHETGCETSLFSVDNCGACEFACIIDNATSRCTDEGTCEIAACDELWGNCDDDVATGCETRLVSEEDCGACGAACIIDNGTGQCTNEGTCEIAACDELWGNCDDDVTTGCETQLVSDEDCGACGAACIIDNGAGQCTGEGACEINECDTGWDSCDGDNATGCEASLTSVEHCGACHVACTIENGTGTCADGTCQIASCDPGYGTMDNDPATGCECEPTDGPDPLDFRDRNCDGIVGGDASIGVFVSIAGDDSSIGSQSHPVQSINRGIEIAAQRAGPRREVYIEAGGYNETIELTEGVSLYGGYRGLVGGGWDRSPTHETFIVGGTTAVSIHGLDADEVTLELLTIRSVNATDPGDSSYAVRLFDNTEMVTISHSVLIAGNGRQGSVGMVVPSGGAGYGGNDAVGRTGGDEQRCVSFLGRCSETDSFGGAGGDGATYVTSAERGAGGGTDLGGFSGQPGERSCFLFDLSGGDAGDGTNGPHGNHGAMANQLGVINSLALYGRADGGSGYPGFPGGGGGGGGGGGIPGDWLNNDCIYDPNAQGGGGGGGGAGGEGGGGGGGGQGGGGSFGVVSSNSPLTLVSTTIRTGDGGDGGDGADGEQGSMGGLGGSGAAAPTGLGDRGGDGGDGGRGGDGGSGAGGAGGPSIGILWTGVAPTFVDVDESEWELGDPGLGGSGAPGAPGGPNGLQETVHEVSESD